MSAADLPSRREVLTGRLIAPAPPEAHVSSLVVHVRPASLPAVRAALAAMPGVGDPRRGLGQAHRHP